MARAYRYAEGDGPAPREYDLLCAIDRFGAQAVMGRPLYAREIKRLLVTENIITGYKARETSENWVEWARDNRALSALLMQAQRDAGEN